MNLDPTFVYGNYVEAILWAGIAVVALVRRNSRWGYALSAALLAFGVSDLVEAQTGAWYDPWWLLAWKALCVALILAVGLIVLRIRRGRQPSPAREPRIEGTRR